MSEMKKRWIALYVENDVGVLAKVSGLFSGKSYNLQSLTVGTTEDETVSRMTISVESDDITFEQIKKQLNRMVEVIKVIDLRLKCQYNNGIHIVQRNRSHDHQRTHGRRSVNIVDKCHSHDGCTASERRLYKRTTDTVIFDRKFTDPPDAPETDTADNCTVQYKFQIKYF